MFRYFRLFRTLSSSYSHNVVPWPSPQNRRNAPSATPLISLTLQMVCDTRSTQIHLEVKPMKNRVSKVALRRCAYLLFIGIMLSMLVARSAPIATANGGPTRLLRTPTVSATQIAFAYANNIWIVERAGGR